jgi:alpha-tubulin suppressor-like RCC1 family protein
MIRRFAVLTLLASATAFAQESPIAAGGFESVAVSVDGQALVWGKFGGLVPTEVTGLENVTAVAAGQTHVLALRKDGTVWAWGQNRSGQLGDGSGVDRDRPVKVMNMTGVVDIAAGSFQSYALKNDGTIWAWGDNRNGQLGDGTQIDRRSPVLVEGFTNIRAIAAGTSHLIALRSDGNVCTWGYSTEDKIGRAIPTIAPTCLSGFSDVIDIAAGGHASYGLKRDGTVTVFGTTACDAPIDPMASLGPLIDRVKAIAAGTNHFLALRDDGSVWACGANLSGQLGYGGAETQKRPIQVSGGLFNVVSIAAGFRHSLARDQSGAVWAWGDNEFGQLGTGDRAPRTIPTPVWDGTGRLRQ